MPEHRATLADICVAGHLVLMLLCSQHFLLRARDDDRGSLEAFFMHLDGMAAVLRLGTGDGQYEKENAHVLDVSACMPTSIFPIDAERLRAYVQKWFGEGPKAVYADATLNVAAMRFVQSYVWRRASIPFKERPCVPLANPLCFPQLASYNTESCTICCSVAGHDPACFDSIWTYERCCQRDFDGLHCSEVRHGEERGEVATLVDFRCLPIEEHTALECETRLDIAEEAVFRQQQAVLDADVLLTQAQKLHRQTLEAHRAAQTHADDAVKAYESAQEREDDNRNAVGAAQGREEKCRKSHEHARHEPLVLEEEAAANAERVALLRADLDKTLADAQSLRSRHWSAQRSRASMARSPCLSHAEKEGHLAKVAAANVVAATLTAWEEAQAGVAVTSAKIDDALREVADADWVLDLAKRLDRAVGRKARMSFRSIVWWVRGLGTASQIERLNAMDADHGMVMERLAAAEDAQRSAHTNLESASSELHLWQQRQAAAKARYETALEEAGHTEKAAQSAADACTVEAAPELPEERGERIEAERVISTAEGQLQDAEHKSRVVEEELRPLTKILHDAEAMLAAAKAVARQAEAAHLDAKTSLVAAEWNKEAALMKLREAQSNAIKTLEEWEAATKRKEQEQEHMQACKEALSSAQADYDAAKEVQMSARLYGGRHTNSSKPAEVEIVGFRHLSVHTEL